MYSLKGTALESNPYFKVNFDGGDLSYAAGNLSNCCSSFFK